MAAQTSSNGGKALEHRATVRHELESESDVNGPFSRDRSTLKATDCLRSVTAQGTIACDC